jgi:apolipoprotein N-acyltransferase
MNKYFLVALSAAGGILTGLAWSSWCSGLILLVSLIPFFMIENYLFENHGKYPLNAIFLYALPGIVIFNIMTLGWITAASIIAAVCVILGQSFFMSFVLWLIHLVRIKAGNKTGFFALISFWPAFELLTLNVVILSPWVNMGNGLAKDILFIQWYEVTGVAGGTLWVLLSNLFLFNYFKGSYPGRLKNSFILVIWILLILIPSAISITRYYTIKKSSSNKNEVVIVQPNIDPFTEKFSVPFDQQLTKTLRMAGEAVTEKTAWLITPETTVDDPVNEAELNSNKYIETFRDFARQHPCITIVTGLVSYRVYKDAEKAPTISARKIGPQGDYQDHFNSAFEIDSAGVINIYHKSKLVPGIEMQFSEGLGNVITGILPDLGGTTWGYGRQDDRACFEQPVSKQVVGPIICYESVFGNYVADYVRKGAQALFIITNDGWWEHTNGYKHHLAYASLRAIETRRQIARCANTGISCIIDIRGKRLMETEWWKEAVLTGEIYSETRITPYVRYGDFIMKILSVSAVLILFYTFIGLPLRKINTTSNRK